MNQHGSLEDHTNSNSIDHTNNLNLHNQVASKKNIDTQLTRVETKPEVLLGDHMGCEIITLKVGASDPGQQNDVAVFSIHKVLLASSSRRFAKMVQSSKSRPSAVYKIHDTCPAVFKLFTEYLYKQVVPGVTQNLTPIQQGARLNDLCQLYVFAEIFEMDSVFLNKIMDKIQDGLVMTGTVLSAPLVKNIYEHAEKTSLLRKLCVATTLYAIADPNLDDSSFKLLIRTSDDFFDEFKNYMVSTIKRNPDPRIRESFQEMAARADLTDSSEAESTSPTRRTLGVHPCQFHVHPQGDATEDSFEVHGCHLLDGQ
ncbi:hypothetical protein ACMFMG_006932 [Clarireedia jacksonii]